MTLVNWHVMRSEKYWWNTLGKKDIPKATSILTLADGGGSNSSNSDLFKEDLQRIADNIGLDIRVCHYPPGTSKWNLLNTVFFPILREPSLE